MASNICTPVEMPATFTDNTRKAEMFPRESYFQESYYDICDVMGANLGHLKKCSFLVFKPDAAVSRCVEKCLSHLAKDNILPFFAQTFRFNRHIVRELWRYELNASTRERYPAIDSFLWSSDSLLVGFSREGDPNNSLSAHLSARKGSSIRARRQPEHLRSVLDAPCGTLNFIHSPDDVADFVRELGVLLEHNDRVSFLQAMMSGDAISPKNLRDVLNVFYENVPTTSLFLDDVKEKIESQLGKNIAAQDEILTIAPHALSFESFDALIAKHGLRLDFWEKIVLFTAGRKFCVQGFTPMLELEA